MPSSSKSSIAKAVAGETPTKTPTHYHCTPIINCAAAALPAKYFPGSAAAASASDLLAAHGTLLDDVVQYLPSDPLHTAGVSGSDLMWKPTLVYDTARKCYTVDTGMRQSWTLCSGGVEPIEAGAAAAAPAAAGGGAVPPTHHAIGDSSRITVLLPDDVHAFAEAFLQSDAVLAELAAARRGGGGGGTIVPPPHPTAPGGEDTDAASSAVATSAETHEPAQAPCLHAVPVQCKVLAYGMGGHFQAHVDAPRPGGHAGTLVLHPPGMQHAGGELSATARPEALPAAEGPDGWAATFVPLSVVHRVSTVVSGVRLSLTLPVYGKAGSGDGAAEGGTAAQLPPAPAVVPDGVLQFAITRLREHADLREGVRADFEHHVKIARKLAKDARSRLEALEALTVDGSVGDITVDELEAAWTPCQLLNMPSSRGEYLVLLSEKEGSEVERWALQQLQAEGATVEFGTAGAYHYSCIYDRNAARDCATALKHWRLPIEDDMDYEFDRVFFCRCRPYYSQPLVDFFGFRESGIMYGECWPGGWEVIRCETTAAMDEGFSAYVTLTIPAVKVTLK